MDIIIREIEDTDYSEVAGIFYNEILGKIKDGKDDYNDVALFFNQIKNDEQYKTFVALFDNHIVGFISTFTMFWVASSNMFIQCFAVKNKYQHKGIGTKLLQHTEDYAKTNGITGAGLQSGNQRTAAHAFYENNGYIKSNYFYKNF